MADPRSPKSPRKGKVVSLRVALLKDTVHAFQMPLKALGLGLWEAVITHMQLLECDYFGLEYTNHNGDECWLDNDKQVLKQLPSPDSPLRFGVKFYTPDPALLEDELTRYCFALQLRRDLLAGELHCSENTSALLSSYIVQGEIGDFLVDEYIDISYLQSFEFAPRGQQTLDLLQKVMDYHRQHVGESPSEADANLLDTARKVEMYGIKFHPAKDHEGVPLNLAVAHMGVLVFQGMTKINTFSWAKVRKLSFKRKKFLIKLHPESYALRKNETQGKKEGLSLGYYKDTVEFFFDSRDRCKYFWKKCIEHHTFFRCQTVKKLPRNKARVVSRGSSFRYSGRTQKELQEFVRESIVKRPQFERSVSGRISSRSTSVTPKISKPSLHNSADLHNSTASSGSHILEPQSGGFPPPMMMPPSRLETAEVHSDSSMSGSRSLGSPRLEHGLSGDSEGGDFINQPVDVAAVDARLPHSDSAGADSDFDKFDDVPLSVSERLLAHQVDGLLLGLGPSGDPRSHLHLDDENVTDADVDDVELDNDDRDFPPVPHNLVLLSANQNDVVVNNDNGHHAPGVVTSPAPPSPPPPPSYYPPPPHPDAVVVRDIVVDFVVNNSQSLVINANNSQSHLVNHNHSPSLVNSQSLAGHSSSSSSQDRASSETTTTTAAVAGNGAATYCRGEGEATGMPGAGKADDVDCVSPHALSVSSSPSPRGGDAHTAAGTASSSRHDRPTQDRPLLQDHQSQDRPLSAVSQDLGAAAAAAAAAAAVAEISRQAADSNSTSSSQQHNPIGSGSETSRSRNTVSVNDDDETTPRTPAPVTTPTPPVTVPVTQAQVHAVHTPQKVTSPARSAATSTPVGVMSPRPLPQNADLNEEIPYVLHRRQLEDEGGGGGGGGRASPLPHTPSPQSTLLRQSRSHSPHHKPLVGGEDPPDTPYTPRKMRPDRSPSAGRRFELIHYNKLPARDSFSSADDTISPTSDKDPLRPYTDSPLAEAKPLVGGGGVGGVEVKPPTGVAVEHKPPVGGEAVQKAGVVDAKPPLDNSKPPIGSEVKKVPEAEPPVDNAKASVIAGTTAADVNTNKRAETDLGPKPKAEPCVTDEAVKKDNSHIISEETSRVQEEATTKSPEVPPLPPANTTQEEKATSGGMALPAGTAKDLSRGEKSFDFDRYKVGGGGRERAGDGTAGSGGTAGQTSSLRATDEGSSNNAATIADKDNGLEPLSPQTFPPPPLSPPLPPPPPHLRQPESPEVQTALEGAADTPGFKQQLGTSNPDSPEVTTEKVSTPGDTEQLGKSSNPPPPARRPQNPTTTQMECSPPPPPPSHPQYDPSPPPTTQPLKTVSTSRVTVAKPLVAVKPKSQPPPVPPKSSSAKKPPVAPKTKTAPCKPRRETAVSAMTSPPPTPPSVHATTSAATATATTTISKPQQSPPPPPPHSSSSSSSSSSSQQQQLPATVPSSSRTRPLQHPSSSSSRPPQPPPRTTSEDHSSSSSEFPPPPSEMTSSVTGGDLDLESLPPPPSELLMDLSSQSSGTSPESPASFPPLPPEVSREGGQVSLSPSSSTRDKKEGEKKTPNGEKKKTAGGKTEATDGEKKNGAVTTTTTTGEKRPDSVSLRVGGGGGGKDNTRDATSGSPSSSSEAQRIMDLPSPAAALIFSDEADADPAQAVTHRISSSSSSSSSPSSSIPPPATFTTFRGPCEDDAETSSIPWDQTIISTTPQTLSGYVSPREVTIRDPRKRWSLERVEEEPSREAMEERTAAGGVGGGVEPKRVSWHEAPHPRGPGSGKPAEVDETAFHRRSFPEASSQHQHSGSSSTRPSNNNSNNEPSTANETANSFHSDVSMAVQRSPVDESGSSAGEGGCCPQRDLDLDMMETLESLRRGQGSESDLTYSGSSGSSSEEGDCSTAKERYLQYAANQCSPPGDATRFDTTGDDDAKRYATLDSGMGGDMSSEGSHHHHQQQQREWSPLDTLERLGSLEGSFVSDTRGEGDDLPLPPPPSFLLPRDSTSSLDMAPPPPPLLPSSSSSASASDSPFLLPRGPGSGLDRKRLSVCIDPLLDIESHDPFEDAGGTTSESESDFDEEGETDKLKKTLPEPCEGAVGGMEDVPSSSSSSVVHDDDDGGGKGAHQAYAKHKPSS